MRNLPEFLHDLLPDKEVNDKVLSHLPPPAAFRSFKQAFCVTLIAIAVQNTGK